MSDLGKITKISKVFDFTIKPVTPLEGTGGSLGTSQMINALWGHPNTDGYKVETDKHTYYVLIDNEQSCCESWGYFSSEDDLEHYIGAELLEVRLTDKALNTKAVEESGYYFDKGGIQLVDFITNKGKFQLAVYNAHNGYYGHGILVARDDEIILNDVL